MQNVFNNEMVAHVWAQQSQDQGRNSNDTFYFYGATIYSYGSHFPVASFIDMGKNKDKIVLINSDTYGNTTSKHQNYTRSAIPGYLTTITVPHLDVRVVKRGEPQYIKDKYTPLHNENLEYLKTNMTESLLSAKKARKESTISSRLQNADIFCIEYNLYLKLFKIRRKELTITNDAELQAIINKRDILRKKEIKREKERQANIMLQNKEKIKQWCNGEINSFPYQINKVYLRINPNNKDEIQTSKHASFPVSHAIRAYKLLKKVCSKKIDFSPINIGYFRITSINKQCAITAGCHYVEWDVIEKMGEKLINTK